MSILQHFQHLPDPRMERTQHHSLVEIAKQPRLIAFCDLNPTDKIGDRTTQQAISFPQGILLGCFRVLWVFTKSLLCGMANM
jgi:hypothetical protein